MTRFVASVFAVAILTTAARARADEGSIGVTYEATPPGSCPTAESFRASVEKRAPNKRVVLGTSDIDAHVALRRTKAKVLVTAANGFVAEREVTGRSCAEIAQASALLVALFADQKEEAAAVDEEPPAEDTKPAPSSPIAPVPAPRDGDRPAAVPAKEPEPKTFAIVANPLSLVVSRYSAQLEWLPASHHAITLNPFYYRQHRQTGVDGTEYDLGYQNGAGAEIGYRYYFGKLGPSGFFFGPSVVAATFWQSGGETMPTAAANASFDLTGTETYTAFGGAFDLGGQLVLGPGVVLGAGLGAQYLFTTQKIGDISVLWEGRAGLSPRLLASVGYAF